MAQLEYFRQLNSHPYFVCKRFGRVCGLKKSLIGGLVPDVCLRLGPAWLNWSFFVSSNSLCVESFFFFVSRLLVNCFGCFIV